MSAGTETRNCVKVVVLVLLLDVVVVLVVVVTELLIENSIP